MTYKKVLVYFNTRPKTDTSSSLISEAKAENVKRARIKGALLDQVLNDTCCKDENEFLM